MSFSNPPRLWQTVYRRRFLAPCILALCSSMPAAGERTDINWEKWTAATFQRAQQRNKLIFLDVGTEWCGACQKQDSITYADPGVIVILNRHFVSIKVDAEAQPDVGELYSAWGWPALIFMLPDGTQINEFAGHHRPDRFVMILNTLLARQRDDTLHEWKTDLAAGADPAREDLRLLSERVQAQLDRSYDKNSGGWGGPAKSPLPIHIEQAFFRAHVDGAAFWRTRALDTLRRTTRLLDPVWGGVFAAGRNDWSPLAPEKIAWKQAGVIQNFAEAYHLTGEPRWLEVANATKRYMDNFLKAPGGSYFNSQDPFRQPGSPEVDHDYYRLDDPGRRELGIPDVDQTAHTDNNARLIIAFARVYAATGDRHWLESAELLARNLVAERRTAGDWYRQLIIGGGGSTQNRIRDLPSAADNDPVVYLRTQAWMGHALLALYGVTGNKEWLGLAQALQHAMVDGLGDEQSGGFYARRPQDAGLPLLPVADNALASLFLQRLAYFTRPGGDAHLLAQAEAALRAVGGRDKVEREGKMVAEYVLALQYLLTGPFEFSVVGNASDPVARELFAAAVRAYEPRKILKYESPGRYPDLGHPTLYICTSALCSRPVSAATDVQRVLAEFQALVRRSKP